MGESGGCRFGRSDECGGCVIKFDGCGSDDTFNAAADESSAVMCVVGLETVAV